MHGWDVATSGSENKWLLYWNSTSGLDFDRFIIIGISVCIGWPNFTKIESNLVDLWRHINFSRWRPWRRISTSGCVCSDGTRLRKSQSLCVPICTIYLNSWLSYYFRFLKKRQPFWNSIPAVDFDLFVVSGILLWSADHFVQIESKLCLHIDFWRWRPRLRRSNSVCGFSDGIRLRRTKSICMPNVDDLT